MATRGATITHDVNRTYCKISIVPDELHRSCLELLKRSNYVDCDKFLLILAFSVTLR